MFEGASVLVKLSQILFYALVSFGISLLLYPAYIRLLQRVKAGKTIRENAATGEKSEIFSKMHAHKQGTPTMGGGMFLIVMLVMILGSFLLQHFGWIGNSLWNAKESYIILFGFFSMGLIGLVDDFLNIKNYGKVKGLSARAKLIGMVIFSAWISYWFYVKLGIDYINLWPIAGKIEVGILFPILTFIATITIVNAINITDGLDGLAGGTMAIILVSLAIVTFLNGTYIATTVVCILVAVLVAFLFFNINPAKVFMGDSGAFALGGLLASLIYLLNMRFGILIPFLIIFGIFIVELCSSFLQIFWKKVFKKKLFTVAPFHHLLEYRGMHETTIVMKTRLVQAILAIAGVLLIFVESSLMK
ncbi:phospho-N-acetylmuramoyl-pentapeptide-transferase [Candidatus Gracilibacteria bacterium]|nr:MAG: phospho-N-acetylmuramoyl-pentapeptide-transferase [Candidatus Gracilibacteria bacterium]